MKGSYFSFLRQCSHPAVVEVGRQEGSVLKVKYGSENRRTVRLLIQFKVSSRMQDLFVPVSTSDKVKVKSLIS